MNNAEINVLMLGARRAGKTSLLASLSQTFNELPNTNIILNQSVTNDNAIDDALEAMKTVFQNNSLEKPFITKDSVIATDRIREYDFNLSVVNTKKGSKHTICFMDVPGEWILPPNSLSENDRNHRTEQVSILFDKADVIIIAIDSVMMLESSINNTEANEPQRITRWLKDKLSCAQSKKLILFVPLKYETYYYSDRENDVYDGIIKIYGDLIDFLQRKEFQTLYQIAIVPVNTMGDIIFDHTEKTNGGTVAFYRFTKENAQYNPKYCEQILIHILSYLKMLIEYGKKQKWKRKSLTIFWKDLFLRLGGIPTDKLFLKEIDKLKDAQVKDKPFVVIQNIQMVKEK